ncbi:hypothetical protein [Paenibacillus apiarius]|uniref:hypothetical protein n=1 Tax=Paenibacillus apiarius TaxID=46240 RepID=UPI003B3B8AD3
MTLDELKDVMTKEDVRRLEIKLQGEILKSNIEKLGAFYSFEILIETKYGRDKVIIQRIKNLVKAYDQVKELK